MESRPVGSVDGYRLVQCLDCQLVRTEFNYCSQYDFFKEVASRPNLEYWGLPEFYQKFHYVFNYYFEERFNRIMNLKKNTSNLRWLDVGAGYGLWQDFLLKKGVRSLGIEIEKGVAKTAQERGFEVLIQSIEEFETEEKFDVITMCDVLEHVKDPVEVLNKCFQLLSENGLLYIQVPNVLGFKLPMNHSYGLPFHLWQFNKKTLLSLISKTNLRYVRYWTGVQGVIGVHERGGPNFMDKMLWFFAKYLRVGNRLQMVLRK